MGQNFFELIKAALPNEVSPQDLIALAPQKWWQDNPYLASAYALRKCNRINWSAYLECNQDVKDGAMDACLHFLRHGVYEGRKLYARNENDRAGSKESPIVSVVIINYNNSHLLGKCLGSVIGQTLKDIEIIVVDDCSTDNSREIIRSYANSDPRIKLIVNEVNSATLIARKRGVEVATGRYLMLLDSDDYMAPNACEIAAREIAKGYDIVKFGAHVVNSLHAPAAEIADADDFCNRGDLGEYFNDEIVTTIFREGKISWHVWSFISVRPLCQNAFAELPDEYVTGPDDLYAQLAISRRARSMFKISDRLIFYNYGPGVSVTVDKDKVVKYAPARARAIKSIDTYARRHSLNIGISTLYRNLCADLLGKLLAVAGDEDVARCFAELVGMLGFEPVLESLFQRHYDKKAELASFVLPLQPRSAIKNIGIFFPKIHYGGMETIIKAICNILKTDGFNITLIFEERSERDRYFATYAHITYIGSFSQNSGVFAKRLQNLVDIIGTRDIDVLINAAPHRPSLLWDLMTFHNYGIPVILWSRLSFVWSLSGSKADDRYAMERIYSRADAVLCQSRIEELYLRLRGINAAFIPSPVLQHPYNVRNAVPVRIAVLGRLGDTLKQMGESLKVLSHVVARAPWMSMCLIGDFYSMEQLKKFRQKIHEMGLERNVSITGWTDNPEQFLRECGVLLSVSACESFPLNIAEAQALGLPCVIYDVPIEQARNNTSIITVPQGDYKAAAAEIVKLFEAPERWQRLSIIAVENSKNYDIEKFSSLFKSLIYNFQYLSEVNKYSIKDYETVINCAAYYSGRVFESF